jgi:tRNA(Arg) A34 adenosine deaminase TadA
MQEKGTSGYNTFKGGVFMDQEVIFWRMLDVIEDHILPQTRVAVLGGHNIFGAAILFRSDLSLITAGTNHEGWNPLWHGEVYTIKKFFELDPHPDPKECLLLSTHEPCSMCLSAVAWSGFPEIYFLFNYEETRDAFHTPNDIQILRDVFYCSSPSRDNQFFKNIPLTDLISHLEEPELGEARIEKLKRTYEELSAIYQKGEKDDFNVEEEKLCP